MKRLTMMTAICAPFACPDMAGAEPIGIGDRMAIIDTITDIAAGADRHQWDRVRDAFADQVTLDYTGLWGGEATSQGADEIVAQWSGFLPGFDRTLHLIANHAIIEAGDTTATAEADFQAVHRIDADSWTLMGHYRYELAKRDGAWKVTRLIMTPTHETGDRGLVNRATERAKASP